ncbi:MAG TPA: hypothetical protein VLA19_04120 [Herpetosiphonaceae bacterium]|nr:hypothetical protein [Herpetosiphonaceae bacterium]
MFGALRTGLVFGLVGAIVVAACLLIGGILAGLPTALAAVALLGWGSGYTAAKTSRARPGQAIGRGMAAGIIAGTLVLLGSILAGTLSATLLREALDVWLQRLSYIIRIDVDLLPYFRGGGLVGGTCLGLVNLGLMAAGGAIGGLTWRR